MIRRRPDALWRRSLDGVVILGANAEEPITVLGPGLEIWELLAEWRTLEALATLLSSEHGADPVVVTRDVNALLDQLDAEGVLEVAADSGGHHGG